MTLLSVAHKGNTMAKNNDVFGSDDRLRKNPADADRGSRDNTADAGRVQNDGGTLSAAERRQMLRQEWVQEVLPTAPEKPGFHRCWLSTTNSTDPIFRRMRQGYQPVKAADIPGFSQYRVSGGEFDGCVQCNEMLLFEIENQTYQDLMTIYHHELPAEAEQSIKEKVSGQQTDSEGRELVQLEEGFKQLGRLPQTPKFA